MGKKTMSPKGDSIPHTHLNINNLNLSLTAMAYRQVSVLFVFHLWGF